MKNNNKKNIAILSWSLNSGGAERAAANLSKDLSDKYNVYLVVFDARNITYAYAGELIEIGIESGSSSFKKIIVFFKRCFKIRKIKKEKNIDVTISFMPHVNFYNVLTKVNDKLIISIRNFMSKRDISKFSRLQMNIARKMSNKTVACADGVRDDLIKNFGYDNNSVITIYNSCDMNWLRNENQQVDDIINHFDFQKPTIVNVGRMNYQKGQWHLLRAFSEVVKEIPNCQLVIFGEGELKEKLEKYAENLGVRENTFMLGFVKNHHKFMEKCNVFVCSSLYEGIANLVLEALAFGVPVVSTDCFSGPGEILNEQVYNQIDDILFAKHGILTTRFSEKDFDIDDLNFEESDYNLAKAIMIMLQDKKLASRYTNAGNERIKDFAPEKIIEKWIDLIENL